MKVAIIGSGISGLSAAAVLVSKGYQVTVYEKNDQPGGRAALWEKDGFRFDMGPSWYWMPEVFESFFALFNKHTSDYYSLERLDPSYRIYFSKQDHVDVPADADSLKALFERIEPGSGKQLEKFLAQAKFKYEVGMRDYVFRPSLSVKEYLDPALLLQSFKIQLFTSIAGHIRSYFHHPWLIKLLEFPVLFLGSTPQKTPALYSLMNYADLSLGTWYPKGGMYEISKALASIAKEQGAEIRLNSQVNHIQVNGGKATGILVGETFVPADIIISNADYHHTEQHLLPENYRNYSERYWEKRVLSPSSLLFYVGLNKRVDKILHHNLFFDEDFDQHAKEIYEKPSWPSRPLFYVSCTSKTDPTVAPAGCENLFFLIPVAPGLTDTDDIREQYFELVLKRFEEIVGEQIREHIILKRSYCINDFMSDYNSFKGNAYGLANTLTQTAFLKPRMRSPKVSNLFYTGQLTVPGPGVPPALISGQVVANSVREFFPSAKVSTGTVERTR